MWTRRSLSSPLKRRRNETESRSQMEKVIWKDIPGYEGYYQVSDRGDVRSVDRVVIGKRGQEIKVKGRMIRPCVGTMRAKYLVVCLCKDDKPRSFLVHRLVALAFFGPPSDGMEVDHINENPHDNRVCNLHYITRFENASRSNLGKFRKSSNAMEHNPRTKAVLGFLDGVLVHKLPCAKYLCELFSINYSTLRSRLQNGGAHLGDYFYCYET